MDPAVIAELDDQIIYQATKDIFIGQKAKFRKLGPVKKSIGSHLRKGSLVQQLVTQYGADAIHQPVLKLLSDRVYESTSIASERFPDLFEPSTAQTAARSLLEAEATRSEQAALEGIIQTQWASSQGTLDCTGITTMALDDINNNITESETGDLSLFPVYLPFPIEHMLMEKLQKTLELACFDFGTRALPDIMRKRGWECPESVELNRWAELFGREGSMRGKIDKDLPKELLRSIASIRHTAVHRLRTNSAGLERFLTDAERLAGILGDTVYAKAISHLRSDAQSAFMELTQNKQFIQLQLEHSQEEIAKKRAELDQEEQEVLRCIAKEDEKYRMLAGDRLQNALERMEDKKIAVDREDAVFDGINGIETNIFYADDSDVDYADQFEDCDETWIP
ncbi:hypothetical protein FOIG_16795 [Fusarium odoratissimum NRRL 54006]|uniref:Ubiquinol-cytochrome-c reductase cytochrome c1 n=2 Tax=Fusarium oxysporum species complex TaxID=171631 RepID=X0IM55_FUSO5|nr:uncharacterized protein FOIG_16795 [Fusarium odoratissimum NRRL 54006]EXL89922.1 hypothetical protein FOIG_16795 [Fusarium odoratissimum NRRL 54006]TXC02801.1 hypothetical protein FocTR4_00014715 [Fusarium oxysporum f. sp. cubense]